MSGIHRQELVVGRIVTAMQAIKSQDCTIKFLTWKEEYNIDKEFMKKIHSEFEEELKQFARQDVCFFWPDRNLDVKPKKWNRGSKYIPSMCWGMRLELKGVLPFGIRIQNKNVIFIESHAVLMKEEKEIDSFINNLCLVD